MEVGKLKRKRPDTVPLKGVRGVHEFSESMEPSVLFFSLDRPSVVSPCPSRSNPVPRKTHGL